MISEGVRVMWSLLSNSHSSKQTAVIEILCSILDEWLSIYYLSCCTARQELFQMLFYKKKVYLSLYSYLLEACCCSIDMKNSEHTKKNRNKLVELLQISPENVFRTFFLKCIQISSMNLINFEVANY